ncbi:P-loop containing nucleoside triphosphate hydrolase protein [Mycena albidolilacea]|uniref:P-loop containing nucleoside triphosphate hydrolase protein n=1 Tax=Mycena albidolilacea TaxID=1033008 RepID=A0AAD7EIF4_9AGAR|nr:P-loop containing nucleoside triphosphate hydrolase protein [Mycena albidolilacea]
MDFNNVERRGVTRKVPMEVLGLGFSRTGTTSLRIALEKLGYKETNHGSAVFKNMREIEMWTEAVNAKFFGIGKPYGRAEWDQLLGHCMAVTDLPHLLFAEELVAAYPEAKVVLTLRDPDSWGTSFANTMLYRMRAPGGSLLAWLLPQTAGKLYQYGHVVWLAMFKTKPADLTIEKAKARYVAYYEEVRRMVPRERLLEYRVGEGWEPLCKFLGKPIPEESFPRTNDTQVFNDHVDKLTGAVLRTVALKYLLPAILVVMCILYARINA